MVKAVSVKPMPEYKVDILLENGRKVVFDMQPFLEKDLYKPLLDVSFFETVKVDEYGVVCWNNDIDISPYLY